DEAAVLALLLGDRLVQPGLQPGQTRRERPRKAFHQASHRAERGVLREQLGLQAEAVGMHDVVGVHARDQLAAAVGQPEIESCDQALTLAVDDPDATLLPGPGEQLRRGVRRGVVHADDFVLWRAALPEAALE